MNRRGPSADRAEALLRRAEREAEHAAALLRIGAGALLLVVVQGLIWQGFAEGRPVILAQIAFSRTLLVLLLLNGLVSLYAVRRGWGRTWGPFLSATIDAVLILTSAAHSLAINHMPGSLLPVMPAAFAVPFLLAGVAIHYRPGLQAYVGALFMTGILVLVAVFGFGTPEERTAVLAEGEAMFGPQPNLIRLIMLVILAAALVVLTVRGRALLRNAVEETVRRSSLARFLPGEIAGIVDGAGAAGLREGRRQTATVVFVDIRDWTTRVEALDPNRLSVFITSFRRRVMEAAQAHGGMIDKFIGDGALVVFGVPDPSAQDAARAFAFADDLLRRIERWNEKRRFEPPLRIGIGIHTGEVYCGLVGDEERIEFTVLGDAVNVASRLEQATKRYGVPVLASQEAVAAAGLAAQWREVAEEVLRGRVGATRIMGPAQRAASSSLVAAS